ncbi:MAG: hypothetical protein XE06_0835 [Anaerolineaceae bacterium 46_22]|jgi:hypothetical protein|nr:MAG: hypothetical protein XE06_0835 [Anaerolineaceae bacterium 46_22]
MFRDYGPGLTVDELIGTPAFHLDHLQLPPGEVFDKVKSTARKMVESGMESFVLSEIWEDGYTVWTSLKDEKPALITPGGQLIRSID